MGYGAKIYQAACQELEIRRRQAEETAQDNLERFFEKCPRAREIRREMGRNGANAAIAVLSGGNVREQLTQMKEQGMALKEEYDKLLAEHHVTQSDVTPQYQCSRCKDTGFVDGRMCQCLKNLQRQMAFQRLSMDAPLENSTFEEFSLEYYREDEKAYRQTEKVLAACKRYADNFRADSPSFLFWGGTGLGKTHLSLAIAGKAIEKGFGVVYGSAQSFAVALERERFLREQDMAEDADVQSQLTDCDLLILDDLGTEASSNYVKSAFYDIINSRMMKNKPTLISTNLTMKDLEKRYTPRFTSRIAGYYSKVQFLGNDVRLQKRRRKTAGS